MSEKTMKLRASIVKHKWVIISSLVVLGIILLGLCGWIIYVIAENRRIDAEAVTLQDDLTIGFGEPAQISDFLANLNGELIEDYSINTDTLGEQEVKFDYINIKNRKRTRSFTITVVDKTPPIIYGNNTYTVNVGYKGDLTKLMLSGDDLDDHPRREIIGEYNLDEVGSYTLEYLITDAHGNQRSKQFTLQVVEPKEPNNTPDYTLPKLPLTKVIKNHKTTQTMIGIDVSSWQGEIDWQKVKDAGVEFAMIRVGYQVDFGAEYVLDKYFKANISGAEAVGLPVGVYFYSYANSIEEAKDQAEWIIAQLKDYRAELGIAFDWEDWGDFNAAGMSFRKINQVAQAFLDTAKSAGYRGWLYGSKVYLDRIWEPTQHDIWLAQYYDYVTYEGDYAMWQLSNTGQVDGIRGDVDLDIMYLDKPAPVSWNLKDMIGKLFGKP